MDLFNYSRRETPVVNIGGTPLGGNNPVRIQSMTNTRTTDTEACVAQARRITDAGGEYVRLTTQGVREAENLMNINAGLRGNGYTVPLIADVHFNPKVADVAALYAEKVRINPGNYGSTRAVETPGYTDEEYERELKEVKERFALFLRTCKANYTAVRIGVNHGSLSARIMSRYGNTAEGMVESCLEFLRVCVEESFTDVVVSVKSSNTIAMIKTVRLLVHAMEEENMCFPLHLGVTEAGEGEDGRIKSALGIGALMADGMGDTIRVSLSEEPEMEIPVARKLADYIAQRTQHPFIPGRQASGFDYLSPIRRKTHAAGDIGGSHPPVVIGEQVFGPARTDSRFAPDYMYCGNRLPAEKTGNTRYILDADVWEEDEDTCPAYSYNALSDIGKCRAEVKFLFLPYISFTEEVTEILRAHPEVVIISQSNHPNRLGEHRALVHELLAEGLTNPVVFFQHYREDVPEDLQIKSAADMGALITDGFCDGIFLLNQGDIPYETVDSTAFAILQAGRLRICKTEYISCPGCGRTLFNLHETIARVKAATQHLKGLKIGIMGCIVNGPGEMADADYGYVGAGRGKVSLYKQKECVERNIPEEEAVERLIGLIERDGDYRKEETKPSAHERKT